MLNIKSASYLGIALSLSLLITSCSTTDMKDLVGMGDGMSTDAGLHTATNPQQVRLYYSNMGLPKHYQVIGHIGVNNDNFMGIPHSQQSIAADLKKEAAALGGTGVMNINSGFEQTTGDVILETKSR